MDSIERHLKRSVECWKRGIYEDGYSAALMAVEACKSVEPPVSLSVTVLVQAARCAYLTARFKESRRYIEKLRGEYQNYLSENLPARFEISIVESNVERRLGNYSRALEILRPFDDCDTAEVPVELTAEKYLVEGACLYYMNEVSEADARLELAVGTANRCGDPRVRARVLTLMGLVADYKGIVRAAEEYFSRAKAISRKNGDVYGEAAVMLNLCILHYREGRLAAAAREAGRARDLFERAGWKVGVCRSILALGNVEKLSRNLEKAEKLFYEALKLATDGSYRKEIAMAREFLADIEMEKGDIAESEKLYLESLEFGRSISRRSDLVVEVARRLGELYMQKGDGDAARRYLREALKVAQALSDRFEKGMAVRALARLYFNEGMHGKGVLLFNKAMDMLRRCGAELELGRTYLFYAESVIPLIEGHCDRTGEEDRLKPLREYGVEKEEVMKNLLKAEAIFSTMDIPYWKEKVDSLLSKVVAESPTAPSVDTFVRKASDVVTIKYSSGLFTFEGFAAVSTAMIRVLEQVKFAAKFDRPVLITGETGTGKELIARLIHRLSPRAGKPFIAVNCAAVPDHLFESEFFGHRKGCFTGALTDRKGLFEEAHGGSLFLDEVGELTTLQQVKFLRVLQEKRVRRLGENVERAVDVRIISATNRDMDDEVARNGVRDDFYFRINAERIHLPPLRKRTEDILAVVMLVFCGKGETGGGDSTAGYADGFVRIETEALKMLQEYPWPGNVRELVAVLERVRAMAGGDVITVDMLPERIRLYGRGGTPFGIRGTVGRSDGNDERLERIKKVLSLCNGNKSAAAKWLGISRGTLYKELRRNGLDDYIQGKESVM